MINLFKYPLVVLVLFVIGSFPLPVSAHSPGQPPFFKINGVYADFYPVPLISQTGIIVPQDLAPQNYMVGEKLNFEIDWQVFGVPESSVNATVFTWENGDGTTAFGLTSNHTYSIPGSYIQSIYAKSPELPGKQLLQSTLLHILPSQNYQIAKPIIKVNGQSAPTLDTPIYFDLKLPLLFEVSGITAADNVVNYQWDFGDGTTATDKVVTHSFPFDSTPGGLSIVSVVLRTIDNLGFISDSYVLIYDTSLQAERPTTPQALPSPKFPIHIFLLVIIVILITLLAFTKLYYGHRKT